MIARYVTGAFTALALFATTAVPTQAQQGVELGVRGGVSVASASLDVGQTFSKSNRTGFVGGVFLNFDAGLFGFQVGGQYAQKGVKLDFGNVVDELSLSYLEIPAVVKLGIPLGVVKPSILGGASLGFNTGCEFGDDDDCKDDFKSTDFSGILGADLAIYVGTISVWADGRYNFGFSDINEASDLVDDLKHRNWMLQAGLGFRLGGSPPAR